MSAQLETNSQLQAYRILYRDCECKSHASHGGSDVQDGRATFYVFNQQIYPTSGIFETCRKISDFPSTKWSIVHNLFWFITCSHFTHGALKVKLPTPGSKFNQMYNCRAEENVLKAQHLDI